MNALIDQSNHEMMENYERYTTYTEDIREIAAAGSELNNNKKHKAGLLTILLTQHLNKIAGKLLTDLVAGHLTFLHDEDETDNFLEDIGTFYHNMVALCNMD
jgi:hypothetical protein